MQVIRRKLVEERILASAANDMQTWELLSRQVFDVVDHITVFACKALRHNPYDLKIVLRRIPMFPRHLRDNLRHIGRLEKPAVIRINKHCIACSNLCFASSASPAKS